MKFVLIIPSLSLVFPNNYSEQFDLKLSRYLHVYVVHTLFLNVGADTIYIGMTLLASAFFFVYNVKWIKFYPIRMF